MKFLLIAMLAHMLGDFVFQTNRMAAIKSCSVDAYGTYKNDYKNNTIFKPCKIFYLEKIGFIFLHVAIHAGITLLMYLFSKFILHNSFEIRIFPFLAVLSIFHFVIDFLKNPLGDVLSKITIKSDVILFIWDQLIHASIIYGLFILFSPTKHYLNLFNLSLWQSIPTIGLENRIYMSLILCIFNVKTVSFFIAKVLKLVKNNNNYTNNQCREDKLFSIPRNNTSIENIGAFIGMLERILISIFIWQGINEGVTIVIAIKAFARFKEMDDKNFAEFYLIGSLLSLMFAITTGLLLRYLF